jgi:bifunctional non-homologous end joining protein LigD
LARYQHAERPTVLVFDLDPGTGSTLLIARWWLSGSRNSSKKRAGKFCQDERIQGASTLRPSQQSRDLRANQGFARHTADELTRMHPEHVIQRMEKRLRTGKVFIDWSQNDGHKTTVCVYSLRAMERPTVSTPVTWDEVSQWAAGKTSVRPSFETEAVIKRVEKFGDLFEPVCG